MIAEKIIIGSETPKFGRALWVDTSTEVPTVKTYLNGEWVAVSGGDSSGTKDYSKLTDKPSINGIELDGNKTSSDLGVATSQQGAKADTAYQKPQAGIPESDLSSDVQQALQKHFKGWLTSTSQLPSNPVVGDYAYVEDNGTTYIYRCATDGEWPSTSTEEKDPADVTFAGGQEVNETYIDDTHLSNPVAGSLAKAEDAKTLYDEIYGVEEYEEDAEVFTSNGGIVISSEGVWQSVGNGSSAFLNVEPGDMFKIVGDDVITNRIGVLKTNNVGNGNDADFSDIEGYTGLIEVPAGETLYLTVPSDGHYIYKRTKNTSGNIDIKFYRGALTGGIKDAVSVIPNLDESLKYQLKDYQGYETKQDNPSNEAGCVRKDGTINQASDTNKKHVTFTLDATADKVRFLGFQYSGSNTNNWGWAFYDENDEYISGSGVAYASNTGTAGEVDIVVDIPEGAVKFRTNTVLTSSVNFTSQFYCYYQYGNNLSEDVSAMKDELTGISRNTQLPQYWVDYLGIKKEEIRDIQLTLDGLQDSFVFITDSHWGQNQGKKSPLVIDELLKSGLTSKVIFGGDAMASIVVDADNPAAKACKDLDRQREFIASVAKYGRFYTVIGNHDIDVTLKTSNDDEQPVHYQLSDETTRNFLIQPINETGIITDVNGSNYIFDNDAAEIRYIVINAVSATDVKKIYDWLYDAITTTPSDYSIVIFNHYGALKTTTNSNSVTSTQAVPKLDDILSAVNLRETGSMTIDGATKTYDFSDADYNVIAYLSGHVHRTLQSYSNGVTHIATSADANTMRSSSMMGEDSSGNDKGTTNEQLLEIVIIDKHNSKIYCKRIGAGADRVFNTTPITIAVSDTEILESSLDGELTWGIYDNDEVISSTPTSERASVDDGVVTGIATGEVVVYAKDENGNREFFNVCIA